MRSVPCYLLERSGSRSTHLNIPPAQDSCTCVLVDNTGCVSLTLMRTTSSYTLKTVWLKGNEQQFPARKLEASLWRGWDVKYFIVQITTVSVHPAVSFVTFPSVLSVDFDRLLQSKLIIYFEKQEQNRVPHLLFYYLSLKIELKKNFICYCHPSNLRLHYFMH